MDKVLTEELRIGAEPRGAVGEYLKVTQGVPPEDIVLIGLQGGADLNERFVIVPAGHQVAFDLKDFSVDPCCGSVFQKILL